MGNVRVCKELVGAFGLYGILRMEYRLEGKRVEVNKSKLLNRNENNCIEQNGIV